MANTIPSSVPAQLTAGDTVQWRISLADYPASAGWVLRYRLINAAGKIDIAASADGDDHLVDVSAVTSAGWAAGYYDYQAYVDGVDSQRKTLANGRIRIAPNLAGQSGSFDNRTDARKCLDALNSALATYGAKAYTKEYEIHGRRMSFNTPSEFLAFRSKLQAEVSREEAANAVANGQAPRNKVYVRF